MGAAAEPGREARGDDCRQAGASDRPRSDERLRASPRGAIQGRDVRLEGLSAGRPAVSRSQPARQASVPDRSIPSRGGDARRHRRRRCERRSAPARRSRPAPGRPHVEAGRREAPLPRGQGLAGRAEVREPRSLGGHSRRNRHPADRRWLRVRRRGLLARRAVRVLRARSRHRPDHPGEVEPRRAEGPVYPARGGRRADQPHRELGPRAGTDPLVARQPRHLLHRGHRGRAAPVPRGGAGRARRAGHRRPEANHRPHLRQGVQPDRLPRGRAPRAARRVRREHRRQRRAPPHRREPDHHVRGRVSARRSGCNGAARTERRSKAGCCSRMGTTRRRGRIR